MIERENRQRQDQVQRGMAKSLEELIAFGKAKGYQNPAAWARIIHKVREKKRRGY